MTPRETVQLQLQEYWERRQGDPLPAGIWLQTAFMLGVADGIAFDRGVILPYPENYELKRFIYRLVGLTDEEMLLVEETTEKQEETN